MGDSLRKLVVFGKLSQSIGAFLFVSKGLTSEETQTNCSIIPTMITTFGVTDGMYSEQIPVQLTLDDLF